MSEPAPFSAPDVTDEDIRWVCDLLRLPTDAFHGREGDDPRRDVLKSADTMDITACPGSGKTTLLVAKLAILAQKWPYCTRGICVLSHTNVARDEIETRLGNTTAGRCLLSYPHFIGTIHAFVNEFLALPLLRRDGFTAVQFSTEIAGDKLWRLSARGAAIKGYLANTFPREADREAALRNAHYVGEDCDIELSAVRTTKCLRRSKGSATFRKLDEWKRAVLEDGYAAYDDTFAYGRSALHRYPYLLSLLRTRFPLLFIDEAQDNSEEQSSVLQRIFTEEPLPVIRQRFGDPNQAIFDHTGASGAETDVFPDTKRRYALPNSHRFGPIIAELADPLGLVPYGMEGQGPQEALASGTPNGPHTIFLFTESSIGRVIGAYAELLADTFSDSELKEGTRRGAFTAIAHVHSDKGDEHWPGHVRHYWPDYDAELARREPSPTALAQYIAAGTARARTAGECYPAVDKIAEGILRLAGIGARGNTVRRRSRCHRHLLELLDGKPDMRKSYLELLDTFAAGRETLTKEAWEGYWCSALRDIAEFLAGTPLSGPDADAFLAWRDGPAAPPAAAAQRCRDNICRCLPDGKEVGIHVGSIHSVKGETHKATLVMESFWNKHNLEELLPWLDGTKFGDQWPPGQQKQQRTRLRLHYVAMTRPSHLLCLAMKRSTFQQGSAGNLRQDVLIKLEGRGWRVKEI